MKTFICEGCGATARDTVFPDEWTGYGTSARAPSTIANWCPTCRGNGTMEQFSVSGHRRAVAIAKSRSMLDTLKRARVSSETT